MGIVGVMASVGAGIGVAVGGTGVAVGAAVGSATCAGAVVGWALPPPLGQAARIIEAMMITANRVNKLTRFIGFSSFKKMSGTAQPDVRSG